MRRRDEGLADLSFVRSQTDLSLLVRTDTGEFLRQSHLEAGGRDDRFYHAHPTQGAVPADPASLLLDFDPLLNGIIDVEPAGGGRITRRAPVRTPAAAARLAHEKGRPATHRRRDAILTG